MKLAGSAASLLSLALAVTSPPSLADDRTRQPVFSSEVSLVLLPVFVMDRGGHAVRGLSAQDFVIEEDGQPAEVVSFRYVDTTSVEDQDEIRQSSAARRRFLLLFDKSFTDPGGLHRAQRAAAELVRAKLKPADLAAVATFDIHQGLRMVANFTDDRSLLSHAVATLGVPSLVRISDPLGLAADLGSTDIALTMSTGDNSPQQLTQSVLQVLVRRMRAAEDQAYRNNVITLVSSLEDLAKALRNVEGRKQILFFSGGFDSRVLVGESGYAQELTNQAVAEGRLWDVDGQARFGDTRARDLLAVMTRSLTRADAVVHAIDTTGLGRDHSLTQMAIPEDHERDTSGRESLNFLASETGGRLFKDTNALGPVMDEMLDMTSRYYVLGFQPNKHKGPGAFHKVKVRVARKGVKVSHRTGYFERLPATAQTPLQRQFEAAQLVMTGVGPSDLEFSMLCLPFPASGPRQTLGLVIQVPKSELRWVAGQTTSMEVYAYAVAEDGTVHDHLAQLARVDPALADPAGTTQGMSFYGALSVPPGRYTVRLLIQERESGSAGIQLMDVTVPPYDPRSGFLLPPVVVDEQGSWLTLEMGRGGIAGRPASPFHVGGKPFLPRASFHVRAGAPEKMVLIAYEPSRPGDPAADVQLRSSLTNRDGKPVAPGALRIQKVHRDDDGRRTFVLGYTPDPLAAGDYTLRIGVGEAGSVLESYSLLRLRGGGS